MQITLNVYRKRDGSISVHSIDMSGAEFVEHALVNQFTVEIHAPEYNWDEHDERVRADKISALKEQITKLECGL